MVAAFALNFGFSLSSRPEAEDFASSAWKNIGAAAGLTTSRSELDPYDELGFPSSIEPLASLMTLLGRGTADLFVSTLLIPSPDPPPFSKLCPFVAIDDAGLEGAGVLSGVPTGVEGALSSRDFLDPERGVILELMKADNGLAIPWLDTALGEVVNSPSRALRGVVEVSQVVEPASLGVNGPLLDLKAELNVGVKGFAGVI